MNEPKLTTEGNERHGAEPEDTEVLNDSDDAILTLVTCYPFDFVGSAPKRFVVRAHRIPG